MSTEAERYMIKRQAQAKVAVEFQIQHAMRRDAERWELRDGLSAMAPEMRAGYEVTLRELRTELDGFGYQVTPERDEVARRYRFVIDQAAYTQVSSMGFLFGGGSR
jgi:hypothetical protein